MIINKYNKYFQFVFDKKLLLGLFSPSVFKHTHRYLQNVCNIYFQVCKTFLISINAPVNEHRDILLTRECLLSPVLIRLNTYTGLHIPGDNQLTCLPELTLPTKQHTY